jgi:hypothetical protein
VISPYTQTGKVDSTFYSQVSVLRTIEQIVGISPMTQFDAAATPMLNSFSDTPNLTPYTAIVPAQNVHEKNPVNPPMAQVAPASLDQVATLVDQNEGLENQVLWAFYGTGPMPAPKTSAHDISIPGSADLGAADNGGTDTGSIAGVPAGPADVLTPQGSVTSTSTSATKPSNSVPGTQGTTPGDQNQAENQGGGADDKTDPLSVSKTGVHNGSTTADLGTLGDNLGDA